MDALYTAIAIAGGLLIVVGVIGIIASILLPAGDAGGAAAAGEEKWFDRVVDALISLVRKFVNILLRENASKKTKGMAASLLFLLVGVVLLLGALALGTGTDDDGGSPDTTTPTSTTAAPDGSTTTVG